MGLIAAGWLGVFRVIPVLALTTFPPLPLLLLVAPRLLVFCEIGGGFSALEQFPMPPARRGDATTAPDKSPPAPSNSLRWSLLFLRAPPPTLCALILPSPPHLLCSTYPPVALSLSLYTRVGEEGVTEDLRALLVGSSSRIIYIYIECAPAVQGKHLPPDFRGYEWRSSHSSLRRGGPSTLPASGPAGQSAAARGG